MTALSFAVILPTSTRAEVWSLTPRGSLGTRYDENLQLAVNGGTDEVGALVLGGLSLVRHGTTTKLSVDSQVDTVRYLDAHQLDRDEFIFNALGTKYFETTEWDLQSNFLRDTTVQSERGTSGLTQVNQPHEHIGVAVSPIWLLTEKFSLSGSAAWSNDSYPHSRNLALVDYDYATLSGQISYSFSERSSGALDAAFAELLVPLTNIITHQYTANLHFDVAVSERAKFSLAAGPIRVASDFETDTEFGYSAKFDSKFLRSTLNVLAGRDVTPNGTGVLSKRERALANLNHDWSNRWSSGLSLQYQRYSQVLSSLRLRLQDVRYASVDGSIRWMITPTLSTQLSMGWNRQELEGIPGIAHSFHTLVSLQWQGLDRGL